MENRFYENQKDILDRMLSRVNDLTTIEGSTTYIQHSPVSIEFENIKLQMDELVNRNNIISAYENGYEDKVVEYAKADGVDRKKAKLATGKQTFYGTPTTVIPVGTKFGNEATGLIYETLVTGVIDSTGECTVLSISTNEGFRYNVEPDTLNYLPIKLSGVTGTTNKEAYIGGADEESIDDLFYRHQLKVRNPATSGNKYHYEQWALEVAGVGYAKCVPAEEIGKGGIVKVIIATSDKRKATKDLIKKTYEHIDKERPILSGTLEVLTVSETPINITGNVEIDESTTLNQVENAFKLELENYFYDEVYDNKRVTIAKIQSILINIPGVTDYSDIKINGNASNVVLNDEEIAILSSVRLGVI